MLIYCLAVSADPNKLVFYTRRVVVLGVNILLAHKDNKKWNCLPKHIN